jgi:hypothetical protein
MLYTGSINSTAANGSNGATAMENICNGTSGKGMLQSAFDAYLRAQIQEIEKYKWCLGVQLKRDPLLDRSYDDICLEWIRLYAAEFRKHWNN